MERVIDVTAVRRQFGTLLDEVFHKGDAVTVVRKGKPMARIVPLVLPSSQEAQISEQQRALLDELDSLPALAMDDEPTALLRTMRKQKRKQAGKEYVYVPDANVFLEYIYARPLHDISKTIMRDAVLEKIQLAVPCLLLDEITEVLCKAIWRTLRMCSPICGTLRIWPGRRCCMWLCQAAQCA